MQSVSLSGFAAFIEVALLRNMDKAFGKWNAFEHQKHLQCASSVCPCRHLGYTSEAENGPNAARSAKCPRCQLSPKMDHQTESTPDSLISLTSPRAAATFTTAHSSRQAAGTSIHICSLLHSTAVRSDLSFSGYLRLSASSVVAVEQQPWPRAGCWPRLLPPS